MIDFVLNSNGDLSFFASDPNSNQFQLDFFTSNNSSLLFDFYIENFKSSSYLKDLKPELVFNFELSNIEYNKDIYCTTSEEDYLFQQIKIRLSSPLETIMGNESIGSTLDYYRHKNIDENIYTISECIKNAIKDIMPNVKVNVEKIGNAYFDYTDSLKITISNKDYNFYYYL